MPENSERCDDSHCISIIPLDEELFHPADCRAARYFLETSPGSGELRNKPFRQH